ncbi:hypothetical protein ACOSQ2_014325 [Xanthoceras sorbifolium]
MPTFSAFPLQEMSDGDDGKVIRGEVNQDETISQEHETRKMKRDQQPLGSQPPVAEPTIAGLTASDGQPNCCERYSD